MIFKKSPHASPTFAGNYEKVVSKSGISITPTGKGYDHYGRVLGEVHLDGKDIALDMINEGLAVYYRPFCKDYPADKDKYNYDPRLYIEAEKTAKKESLNMWADKHVMLPCRYRRLKK